MKPGAFKRGFDRGSRKHQLKVQGMVNRTQLALTESLLRGALEARKNGSDRPDGRNVARMMRDWLIIHEELGGE